jgi:hypothetical protein
MLPTLLCLYPLETLAHALVVPALRKAREGRGTQVADGASYIKAWAMPPALNPRDGLNGPPVGWILRSLSTRSVPSLRDLILIFGGLPRTYVLG